MCFPIRGANFMRKHLQVYSVNKHKCTHKKWLISLKKTVNFLCQTLPANKCRQHHTGHSY